MLRFIQEVNTTTRSCALWDLDEDTEYIVHVQSISMGGSSPPSEPVFFRTSKESEKLASQSPGEAHQNILVMTSFTPSSRDVITKILHAHVKFTA